MPSDARSKVYDDKLGVPSQGNPPLPTVHSYVNCIKVAAKMSTIPFVIRIAVSTTVAIIAFSGCAAGETGSERQPQSISLQAGQGCSYSPLYVGQNGAPRPPSSNIVDIKEVLDGRGLTIGYLYVLDDKTFAIQGNALMSSIVMQSYGLGLGGDGPLWTNIVRIKRSRIRQSIISCRPRRVQHQPISSLRLERDASKAYHLHRDFIDDPMMR